MTKTKQLILQYVKKMGSLRAADLVSKYRISRQAINRHLQDLIAEGQILKQGGSNAGAFYVYNDDGLIRSLAGRQRRFKKRVASSGLSEDILFNEMERQAALLGGMNQNDIEIFRYAFTEMVNNAIDHSGAKLIDIDVHVNRGSASFDVVDKGVGAFDNILKKKNLGNEMEAIQDLIKGKLTTSAENHSGEGIFFTSKVADKFEIESHRKRLIFDNRIDDVFVEDRRHLKGTTVHFHMDLPSKRDLTGVFRKFTGEDFSFDRTRVKVKLFDSGDSYISRSQAKRLLHSMESFREIVLDFAGVKTVGQAFADEVFRVFKNAHPEITISYENAGENVEFMIRRASPRAGP